MNKPTYFVTTGFPKSGNSWLEAMWFDLDGVGGYSTDASRGLPVTVQILSRCKRLREFLDARGVSFEAFFKRLLDPERAPAVVFDKADLPALEAILEGRLSHLRRIGNNFYEEPDRQPVTLARLTMPFREERQRNPAPLGPLCGCPSKHLPPHELDLLLPSFRIVHIVRDPRDVIVSYFYHDLGALNRPLMDMFVRRRFSRRLALRRDWKVPYFKQKAAMFQAFFSRDVDRDAAGADVRVRYEDLLQDTAAEMDRIAGSLGAAVDRAEIERIVGKYGFETVTGSTDERRNSFIRSGRAGDWRRYFSRDMVPCLGPGFVELVRRLGYEVDDAWVDALPEEAPERFDFSRFRLKRSAVSSLIGPWIRSEALQGRYPRPFDVRGSDTYFEWLTRCDEPEVRQWLSDAGQLQKLWHVDIEEDRYH